MKQFLFAQAATPTAPASAPTTPTAPSAPASTPATTAAPATPAADAPTMTAAPATEQVATTETQPADNGSAPTKNKQGGGFFDGPWIMLLIIFAIFYFMMIKPQQRKEKERRQMIADLRAGARVVFAGGLIGTIVEAKETTFKIEIAGDVVIEVARNAVQGLAAENTPAEPKK